MANFCAHHLFIEGDEIDLELMLSKELRLVKDKENNDTIDLGFIADFDLNCKHLYEVELLRIDETRLLLIFETKWNSTKELVNELSRRYPSVHFYLTFYERGQGFAGHYVVEYALDGEPVVNVDNDGQYTQGSLGG